MFIRNSMFPILLGLALVSGCAHAERPQQSRQVCTPTQADAADAMVDKLTDWEAVDAFYDAYRQCDDGSIAEGSSEAVARLLVDRWGTLPRLLSLAKDRPALRTFVLRHINTTLDTDDLNKIVHNAVDMCPKGATDWCSGIRGAAEQALK